MSNTGPLSDEEKKWQLNFSRRLDQVSGRRIYCTAFLDPRQLELAEMVLAQKPGLSHTVYGGHPAAERNTVCIYPSDKTSAVPPLKSINVNWKEADTEPGHRDILGAVMSLGLRRDQIGDILLLPAGGAAIIIQEEKAEFIAAQLQQIGSIPVQCSIIEPEELPLPREDGKQIKGTVASLRIDAVLSLGFGVSRSRVVMLVKGGLVRVNFKSIDSPSYQLGEGDQVSLKGRGRLVIEEVEGETRKGRIRLKLKKYS